MSTVFPPLRSLKVKEGLPRVFVDFGLVQLSMIIALAVCVFYHAAVGQIAQASTVIQIVRRYYFHDFWALSLVFPLVFLLNGFYTRSRSYTSRYKALVVLRGVGLSILVFLAANYLLFREALAPRSVTLVFCCLVMFSLTAVRYGKAVIQSHFEIRPRTAQVNGASLGPVLVVGGAGYIGSIVVRQLLQEGRRVRVLDNLLYGDAAIADLRGQPDFELITGDCRNIQNVVKAVKGVDAIIDLAAIVGDPACEEDRQMALEINYAATRMLIEIAKGNGVGRFIFASSCSVYGATDEVMTELSEVAPISLYAQTKIDSERVLLQARSESFHPTILRLATVFGQSYRPRFDLVVNLLSAKAHQEGIITIYNGDQWRPFIHVRDVAAGLIAALKAPIDSVSGEVFNLGDTRMNCTLASLGEKIRLAFPATRVEPLENSDRRNYRVSFEKAARLIGFQCAISIEEGITEIKRFLEHGGAVDYRDALYHNQRYLHSVGSPTANATDTNVMAAFAAAPAPASAIPGNS